MYFEIPLFGGRIWGIWYGLTHREAKLPWVVDLRRDRLILGPLSLYWYGWA